jgi:hypothetical protein
MPIRENDGDEDADNETTTNAENVEVEQEREERQEPEVDVVEASGDEQEGDERISQSDDSEDDRRPQRKKESAAERRQRAKEAKIRDKRELDFQRRELARMDRLVQDLTQGQVVTRVTELDSRISSAQAEVQQWDQVKARAITAKNGDDAVAADNLKAQAQQKLNEALWTKNQVVAQAQQPRQQEPPHAGLMKEFMDSNPWYDHNGGDEDSLIVKAIDTAVAAKYKPTDPRYWRELQQRVDARLGKNRSESSADDQQDDDMDEPAPRQRTRSGPPVGGSTRSNSGGGGGGTVQIKLSPERVQAMKDAGLWEDPKVRARMAKTYAQYDKNNRG